MNNKQIWQSNDSNRNWEHNRITGDAISHNKYRNASVS